MKSFVKKFLAAALALSLGASVFAQQAKPDALKIYNNGDYRTAIQICEQELLDDPTNIDSYVVLCWALVANKQYSEAELKATEARKLYAYDTRLIEVLAEAKFYLGKNSEALNLFERYIANVQDNAPRLARVYYFMGEIYILQARYQHADISLSMATRIETLNDYWWARLGYAREMVGDYQNAIIAYDKSLKLNPSQYDAKTGKTRCQKYL